MLTNMIADRKGYLTYSLIERLHNIRQLCLVIDEAGSDRNLEMKAPGMARVIASRCRAAILG
jgi:hypothetical protein